MGKKGNLPKHMDSLRSRRLTAFLPGQEPVDETSILHTHDHTGIQPFHSRTSGHFLAVTSLVASYAWCRHLTRDRARNFYYAIRMLPAARRDAMCAVYAFFRKCDDLSDEGQAEERRERLECLRKIVHGAEPDSPSPGLEAFRDAVQRYGIPVQHFSDLIDGMLMDLDETRYETFQDLYGYCYRVASTVGLVCLRIFGFDGRSETEKMAEHLGIAFQLTNILRDVAEDAAMGRVYLPSEILSEFGMSPQNLLDGQPGPAFGDLIRHLAGRARHYYELAEDLPARIDPSSRPALRAMRDIYRGILEKVERLGADVWRERARLILAEKLLIVLLAWFEGIRCRVRQFLERLAR
jgi:phytoene synthase